MWRDILVIAAFVLAGLMYFGLTPRRLSAYAGTAKVEIARRNLSQKIFLSVVIGVTLCYIFVAIRSFQATGLGDLLMTIALFIVMWVMTLVDVWRLSERWEKVALIVASSVMLPVLVAGIILSDMLLWQKVVYPLGGAGTGFGLNRLVDYVGARRGRGRSSKEGDN